MFLLQPIGLARVSRQEESQQGTSWGDDISRNGKHYDSLPVHCLGKTRTKYSILIISNLSNILHFLVRMVHFFYYSDAKNNSTFVCSWCPVCRYQHNKWHPTLPICVPSRWKTVGTGCKRNMRMSTRKPWLTLKSLWRLWMDQIWRKPCKNKFASGLLSVGKIHSKNTKPHINKAGV